MLHVLVILHYTIIHYGRTLCYVMADTPPHYIVHTVLCGIFHGTLHYDIMVYDMSNVVFILQYATVYRALVYYILLALFLYDSFCF